MVKKLRGGPRQGLKLGRLWSGRYGSVSHAAVHYRVSWAQLRNLLASATSVNANPDLVNRINADVGSDMTSWEAV